ncbi:MAG: two-component system, NtrC family, sensor histidine kinase AtoS [Chloroflexota bacterium]|nr:two-component system, NtrC family, sensor histidine kinase AtoS [Chloroflexota bacterium]
MILNNPFSRVNPPETDFQLNSEDFRILLDQIPDATVLVQMKEHKVVAVNYAYTELSGYGTSELANAGLERVLLNVAPETLSDGSTQQLSLIRKSRNPIRANVRVLTVNQNDQLAILRIQLLEKQESGNEALALRMLKGLLAINLGLPGGSRQALVERLLSSACEVFLAKFSTFYFYERGQEKAEKIEGDDTLFPQSLTAVEMRRLTQADVWEPGKRVLSEIHRAGRLNNLSLIITLPVALQEPARGLLVLAWDETQNNEDRLLFLQVFAEWAGVLLRNQQTLETVGSKNEALGMENDQYAQFYENAGDSALLLDEQDQIIDINQNSAALLKYTPIELLNQPAQVIFENSILPVKLKSVRAAETIASSNPVTIYDREGNKLPVYYKIVPLERELAGRKLLILMDASVQIEAEYKIQQYENKAALGEVIADFAHEVRNPLHSFVSGLQIMKKKSKDEPATVESLDQMLDDCNRINDLMESVLSYSRQKVENFKDVNVDMLVRRIFSNMRNKFGRANVTSMVNSQSENPMVFADQRSLEQVFINIVTNAYDAIREEGQGGVISVQIAPNEADARYLDVNISDTGPGIPPEIQAKIFEPFVSGKAKGTGLGLAITKRIIEAHKGRIELETYPGGTIFKVILPNQEIAGEQA